MTLFTFAVAALQVFATPTWEFVGEHVALDIREDAFIVTGEYEFRVHKSVPALAFRYPFPSDDSLGAPELLEASIGTLSGWRPLDVVQGDGCWRWIAEPEADDQCIIRIVYRQTMHASHAQYVLTSTRSWHRPIDRACLEVRVPLDRDCRIAPPLPFVGMEGGWKVYRKEFVMFDPTENLRVDLWQGD